MLIEFRVENHRSLRDEQVLTMEATPRVGDPDDQRLRNLAASETPLLPVAVIYGPNASGKSNLLYAFGYMCNAVLNSFKFWNANGGVPRNPFRWGRLNSTPSTFEAKFLLKDIRYEYGFSVTDDCVAEEWAYGWPNGRKVVLFERDFQDIRPGAKLKATGKEPEAVIEVMKAVTRPNALFLSVAAQHQHSLLSQLYIWFLSTAFIPTPAAERDAHRHDGFGRLLWSKYDFSDGEDIVVGNLRKIFRAADVGIVDVRIQQEFNDSGKSRARVQFQHRSGDESSWLDLEDQSNGTQRLFRMATPLYQALASGGRFVIDELEASLHPLIGKLIVNLFNDPELNPLNAQLLFTTHDTNLLGNTLGDPPLRRDQIWLTEKDKDGATTLYPLTDYKPRKEENLERGYLQGRYGAIPFLGELAISKE